MPDGHRLYHDLADWWPLISPPAEYTRTARFVAAAFGLAAGEPRDVLDLGSGGGHLASQLPSRFAVTMVDLSAAMLEQSRRLNPGRPHLVGDMRTVRLGRTFDVVLAHDAIDYMTTEAELGQVIDTAFAHCRPGGVVVLVPDNTTETFRAATGYGGSDGADGRGARFLEWAYDPDPADSWTLADYAFLLRGADGAVRVVHETHRFGLFGHATWLRLLAEGGFEPQAIAGPGTGDTQQLLFAGRRPST